MLPSCSQQLQATRHMFNNFSHQVVTVHMNVVRQNNPAASFTTHLQALQHGRSCESLRHGSSIGISLGHIHSSNVELHHGGSVTAAGGVGAGTATGSSSGVIDAAGDDPRGISRGQPQLGSNTAGEGEGRCAL